MRFYKVAFLILLSPSAAIGQVTETTDAIFQFHQTFYLVKTSGDIRGVPISLEYSTQPSPGPIVTSSGPSTGLGFGIFLGDMENPFFLSLEFESASSTFSDWRINNRKISFNMFTLNIGGSPFHTIAFAPYVSIGVGRYKQRDYMTPDMYPGLGPPEPYDHLYRYEYLPEVQYPKHLGFGLFLGFLSYFSLRVDFRIYGLKGNDPIPSELIGTRTSMGLQIHIPITKRR